MIVQQSIESKLTNQLSPVFCEIDNESHQHNVPPNSETHFKVTIVSRAFEGKTLVARHQMIYRLLSEEMAGTVHALALHTYTESEWKQSAGSAPKSPDCRGGGK